MGGVVRTTATERFAALLKQGGQTPEVREFRDHARDVFKLGGIVGLDHWLEARIELGLVDDKEVSKAMLCLHKAVSKVLTEILEPLVSPPEPKPRRSWEEQQKLINERESKRREQLATIRHRIRPRPKPLAVHERMEAAWKRRHGQRDVP